MQSSCFEIPVSENVIVVSEFVRLIKEDDYIRVVVNTVDIYQFHRDDQFSKNIVIVNLLKNKLANHREIAEAFGIGINQPRRLYARFVQYGLAGLYPLKKGPKHGRIITPEIHKYIVWKLQRKVGIAEILRNIQDKFDIKLSRTAIEIIRKTLPKPAKTTTVVLNDTETLFETISEAEVDYENETEATSRKPETSSTSAPIQNKDVQTVCYAGLFMLWGFLWHLNFLNIITQVFSDIKGRLYFLRETFLNLFFAISLRVRSIEDYKMLNRNNLASLWGAEHAMDLRTIRRKLDELKVQQKSMDFLFALSKTYLKIGLVQKGVLYFDGHFIPYYGKNKLAKGFFSQKRLVVPGQEQFFVNDLKGRPLFFLLEEGNQSLLKIIPKLIRQVREITNQHSFSIVFDRGGYSVKSFKWFAKEQITFYTYLKNPQFQVASEAFETYEIKYRHLTKKAELAEVGLYIRDGNEFYSCRDIVRKKQDHQTHIITNDMTSEIDTIASLMFNRWGQENFFKYMVREYKLNSICSYFYQDSEQKIKVKNPARTANRKQVRKLKVELSEVESKLLKKLSDHRQKNKKLSEIKERNHELIRRKKEIKVEIKQLNQEHKKMPEQIQITQDGTSKVYKVMQKDKKIIIDSIKLMAYNAEEWLLEHFALVYKNNRDARRILFKILNQPGSVQWNNGNMSVVLDRFDCATHNKIAKNLCINMNKLKIKSPNGSGTMHFDVKMN